MWLNDQFIKLNAVFDFAKMEDFCSRLILINSKSQVWKISSFLDKCIDFNILKYKQDQRGCVFRFRIEGYYREMALNIKMKPEKQRMYLFFFITKTI